jgi:hypothetical protein
VTSQPEVLPLAELQLRFAAVLRAGAAQTDDRATALADSIVDDGLAPAARMRVYRNNVRAMFEGALARTYPVIRQQIGEDHFARLVAEYRLDHPSRSGDLHWTGEHFPRWIGTRMAGSDHAWLADLARLEWACEEALVSEWLPAAPADSLAHVPPEELAGTLLALQPGLRMVDSAFAIWSVWQANQPGATGDRLDPSLGPEYVAVIPESDGLALHSLPVDQYRFVGELSAGRTLEQALDASGLAVERLAVTLAWLYGASLVTAVESSREFIDQERAR